MVVFITCRRKYDIFFNKLNWIVLIFLTGHYSWAMKSSDKNTQMWLNQENLTTNVKHVKDMPGDLNTNKISQNASKVMHQEIDPQRGYVLVIITNYPSSLWWTDWLDKINTNSSICVVFCWIRVSYVALGIINITTGTYFILSCQQSFLNGRKIDKRFW